MSEATSGQTLKIMVYSDDRTVRDQVRLALGRQVAADLPPVEVFDVATGAAALRALDNGRFDLLIFDAEAVPVGGMGLAYQIKDEIPNCPPVLLLVGRVADSWLATWSRAEAMVPFPVDPVRLPQAVADLARRTAAATA